VTWGCLSRLEVVLHGVSCVCEALLLAAMVFLAAHDEHQSVSEVIFVGFSFLSTLVVFMLSVRHIRRTLHNLYDVQPLPQTSQPLGVCAGPHQPRPRLKGDRASDMQL
jgi:hypothetical protein